MDRLTWTCWGLILSLSSVAVVAYRNDLSSTRHGCIWSTIDTTTTTTTANNNVNLKETTTGSILGIPNILVPSPIYSSSGSSGSSGLSGKTGGVSLNCNLRTLSVDFWNYTFNREQIEQTRIVRIKCSDKLFFESLLSPNQTLFQLRNLKEVQIESCKIRKVPRRVWASLPKLKSLVIRTENTQWRSSTSAGLEIDSGAFEGLGELEMLDLSQNNIWTFPENQNVLCPLRNLKKLNVSHNRFSDIGDLSYYDGTGHDATNSGVGMTTINRDNYCALNVQNLDLSYNSIRRIGKDAFSRMRRVTEIRLQENLIAEIVDSGGLGPFEGLSDLRLLNLSSNRIVALSPTTFKTNTNLRELYLQNNSISALSPSLFANLDQLLLLDLSQNTLTSQFLKEDIFQGLIRLVVLKLHGNRLSFIDGNLFKGLPLQSLSLNNNKIEAIDPNAFLTLKNLHILDLNYNNLVTIDSKVFSNLYVLRQLYMDHNKIRKMDEDSLKNCTSLEDLGMVGNKLTEVPGALRDLPLLKTLDLGQNRISSVSNFNGLSNLYGLRLVDNLLEDLPKGLCDPMPRLRVLNVAQNRIRKIEFTSCSEVKVIRLDSNLIEELPPTLATQLPNLLWMNISTNRVRQVDYTLLPPSLEFLDVSHNEIETLKGVWSKGNNTSAGIGSAANNLRVVDISYNNLKQLDRTAIPIALETFRVNHNKLRTIAEGTFLRSKIRRVELIGNEIENLPLTSIRVPQIPAGHTLPEFYLGGNPFICDCTMEWLTRVNQISVFRQHPRIVDLDAIVCRTTFSRSRISSIPIQVSGTSAQVTTTMTSYNNNTNAVFPLVKATPRDFLCTYKTHCFLCECCEFDACDCEMICPNNCTCYHDDTWSANIVQCSNLNYEEIPSRIPMDATEIYLDGNPIFQLKSHTFIGKKNLRALYLNQTHLELVQNKSFNGLKSLERLYLQDNIISELHGFEFADLEGLRELYLQNNLLRYISPDTFVKQRFLEVLRLDGNLLVNYQVKELSRNSYLNSVMLSENPWSCDCEFLIPFRTWVASKASIVVDFTLATCQMRNLSGDNDVSVNDEKQLQLREVQPRINSMCNSASDLTFNYNQEQQPQSGNGNSEAEINNHISAMGGAAEKVASTIPSGAENHLNFSRLETDSDNMNTLWALILCLSAFLIVILVIVLVFRQEIFYWVSTSLVEHFNLFCFYCCCCFGKNGSKISCPSSSSGGVGLAGADDLEKLFDAYFLYSMKDEDVLLQKIVPELEDLSGHSDGQKRLRLCLHYRDLCLSPESPWNREMILSACDASKRVVIVLSRTFLQSEWASSIHFRTSIQSAINLHQKKLILLILPPFTDQNLSAVSPELSKLKNSVEWTDKNFWSRFRRLLPAPGVPTLHTTMNMNFHHQQQTMNSCGSGDPLQLPYNLIMNPNLEQLDQFQRTNNAANTHTNNSHHYHQNIIPYQIPISRNDSSSLPPIPKHQIVLPAIPWDQTLNTNSNSNTNSRFNPQQYSLSNSNHNAIISPNNHSQSTIHPIPSQLTPQHFGYSNEAFHLQTSNHNHNHHPHQFLLQNHHQSHSGHNNNQPIHFSSQPQQTQQNPLSSSSCVIPPHSHSASQLSNSNSIFSPSVSSYPPSNNDHNHHHHHQNDHHLHSPEQNYSSSAVSSCANEEFDHVYSTLDSPIQSPTSMISSQDVVGFCPNGGACSCGNGNNSSGGGGGGDNNCHNHHRSHKHNHNGNYKVNQHKPQHSHSSGISSGSDLTSSSAGDTSSSAVSPSSPIKNGILNKLNPIPSGNNNECANNLQNNNGKMYFV